MNLDQIINEVNKDADDDFDNATLIGWINRALDDLSLVTKKEVKHQASLPSPIMLPEDLMEMVYVFIDGEEFFLLPLQDRTSKGYKVWGSELTLQNGPESGDIEVYYYKRLSHLKDGEDVPEIEPAFHDLLVLYATAYSQYSEEEPERQMDAFNRYLQRKREYELFINKNSNAVYQVRLV